VQSIYKLSSGGAVKVTIEQYMTPLGKPVNGVGITPDIAVQGSIPQFVTALREAKSTSIRVGFINDRVEINGLFMSERISPVWSSGVLYAPARILASMVGGQLVWNETTEAIEVTSPVQQILGAAGPSVVSYDVNNGYLNQDGVGFIDVSLFQKQFHQLTYSSVDSQVVLMIETGKENR
jgi:carboxyl-terminal processing protease